MVIGESYLIFCIFINNFSKIFMLPKYDLSESMNSFQTVSWVSLWFRSVSGESHGWRSLVGCTPWGCEESDMTEQLHFSLLCIGEGNGNPLQCSCLENPRDEGAWWAAVYGVAQSQTRLKRLSSSNRRSSSASQTLHTGITQGSCFWCRFWLAGPKGCGLVMLRVCISHQLPGGGGAAGPWSTFWVDLWNIVANCLRVFASPVRRGTCSFLLHQGFPTSGSWTGTDLWPVRTWAAWQVSGGWLSEASFLLTTTPMACITAWACVCVCVCVCMCVCVYISLGPVWPFVTPWSIAYQAPLSMGFSWQEYWNELLFPSPGDPPNPGIKRGVSCVAGKFFSLWVPREAPFPCVHPLIPAVTSPEVWPGIVLTAVK